MCNRVLRYISYRECGHHQLIQDTVRDCLHKRCAFSSRHPTTCLPSTCQCRRYYTHPERMVTGDTLGTCSTCEGKAARLVIT